MTDPLSLVALGAAIGGATGKFVEKAWDSGEKWLTTYYQSHRPNAMKIAETNSADFLNELASRIKVLEDTKTISAAEINQAQDQPDFSVMLQKALLSASQTSDVNKHKILAQMISERLGSSPESLISLTSKIAVDVIGNLTANQIRLLALISNIYYVNPTQSLSSSEFSTWLTARLGPYSDISFSNLDLLHLESLSCLKNSPFLSRNLTEIIKNKNSNVDEEALVDSNLLSTLNRLWDEGLKSVDLTSVGQLIGVYTSDIVCGSNTSFTGWK